MSQYMLDTNIASYIIKGHPAVRRRLAAVPMHEVAISAVTEGELRYGVGRRPAATRLNTIVEEFLLRVAIHPWDSAAAREYGRTRTTLELWQLDAADFDRVRGVDHLERDRQARVVRPEPPAQARQRRRRPRRQLVYAQWHLE